MEFADKDRFAEIAYELMTDIWYERSILPLKDEVGRLDDKMKSRTKETFFSVLGEGVLLTAHRFYMYASDFSMKVFLPDYPTLLELEDGNPEFSPKAKSRTGKLAAVTGAAALAWLAIGS